MTVRTVMPEIVRYVLDALLACVELLLDVALGAALAVLSLHWRLKAHEHDAPFLRVRRVLDTISARVLKAPG